MTKSTVNNKTRNNKTRGGLGSAWVLRGGRGRCGAAARAEARAGGPGRCDAVSAGRGDGPGEPGPRRLCRSRSAGAESRQRAGGARRTHRYWGGRGCGGAGRGALSGAGPGRALRAAGSAARPVPSALRARLSAGRWEGPAESRRPGQRAAPGIAAAAPGVPRGTAGQPEGKGTAGAALPVRQRPGPRAAPTSRRGTINVKPRTARPGANRSARAAPEEGGRAAAVPSQRRRAGGAARDHRSLFRPREHARSGRRCGAGTALRGLSGSGSEASSYNCCCCGGPARPPQPWLCGRAARSLFSLRTAPQTPNAASSLLRGRRLGTGEFVPGGVGTKQDSVKM
ncbi:spidroin-1-like [Camarhynchus parvulus]|uniref:spidroin-1-like n=1 Tax=Geospiza parvula TaxID=87175 RepID=UPI001237D624|nr:spidroin-1-like [Camarhynchus parvulus]